MITARHTTSVRASASSNEASSRRPAHRNTAPHGKPHRRGRREARLRGNRHQVRGYDVPKEEPDQERFERIAAAYLAESEVEDLTSIRYDIVSLLATGPERILLRHHKNVLNDGR